MPARAERTRRLVQAVWTVSCGLLGVIVALWLGVARVSWQRRGLERQLVVVAARQRAFLPIRDLESQIDVRERLVREATAAQAAPVEWLQRLADGFPSALRLTSLSDDAAGQVHLAGQAQGGRALSSARHFLAGDDGTGSVGRAQTPEAAVSEFAMWVERSGLCGEVRLESNQRSASVPDLVEFGLTCRRR